MFESIIELHSTFQKFDYDYTAGNCPVGTICGACADVCGHYTQAVWHNSYAVGCGISDCGARIHLACHYGEGGNYQYALTLFEVQGICSYAFSSGTIILTRKELHAVTALPIFPTAILNILLCAWKWAVLLLLPLPRRNHLSRRQQWTYPKQRHHWKRRRPQRQHPLEKITVACFEHF